MAQTLPWSEERISTSHVLLTPRFSKLLLVSGILAIIVGLGSMAGGVVGAIFTWDQAATQNVTTPDDASIPETAVRGPFTTKRCASTPTSRDTSSSDSPRNNRNTTSILRFADHVGFALKSPASLLDTDMSVMLAPIYRLSNHLGSAGRPPFTSRLEAVARDLVVRMLDV